MVIALAGLFLGGCGSISKQSPGELVAQRVPAEQVVTSSERIPGDNSSAPAGQRRRLDELIPASAQVCVPAYMVEVQLQSNNHDQIQPDPPAVPRDGSSKLVDRPAVTAVDRPAVTAAADGGDEELERLQSLAQHLLSTQD